jgi:pimeloyl-ACP methyl ester carboxylesterase
MAIIDGTGQWSDSKYSESMDQSFCSQLGRGLTPQAKYERGPSGEGYRIRERSARAVEYLEQQRGKRLMLAGYSRGGSAAVIAASLLEVSGLTVEHLFLFDPVARHLSGDSETIPANVKNAWVVRRRIGAPEMNSYDYTLLGDPAGHNPVRNWFGTTATKAAPGVNLSAAEFLGSHGALGGVGWTHVKEDPQCQSDVAKFMNAALSEAGLQFQLIPRQPNSVA